MSRTDPVPDLAHPDTPPADPAPALHAAGVSRRFGAVRAVDGVDLSIPAGQVVALLGPNGAGKTTLLDMALGFSSPSSGSVRVLGQAPGAAVRAGRVGAVLQTGGLLKDLSVRETVAMVAGCHRRHIGVDTALDRAGLRGLARRKVKSCSGGEQQRLRFALALLTDPELLILDEPTAGMDVGGRHGFWEAMHAEAARGRTVVFATHFLPEAEDFADRIVLMQHGRIHADGAPDALAAGGAVTLSGRWTGPDSPDALAAELGLAPDAVEVQPAEGGDRVRVLVAAEAPVTGDEAALHVLSRGLLRDVAVTRPSLDEMFLSLTRGTDSAAPSPETVPEARA